MLFQLAFLHTMAELPASETSPVKLPDILTPSEIERMICAARKMRYRVFLLTTYSMGLRLREALSLEVGDIDGERRLVHVRRGKGHKDRMVPLPESAT